MEIPDAWYVGNRVRKRFKNVRNWNSAVNRPGAHDEILEIILDGLPLHVNL